MGAVGVGVADDSFCDGASQWVLGPVSAGGCEVSDQIKGMSERIQDNVLSSAADSIATGLSNLFTTATSFWVKLPTPGVTQETCRKSGECTTGPNETLAFLWDHLAWTQRKEPARDLLRSLVTFVVTSTAGVAALGLAIEAGDQFSNWIVAESGGRELGTSLALTGAAHQVGAGIVIVMGILGILLSGVQAILMIFRLALLTLMMGFLPLAASATNMEWGRNWFRRTIGWTIAFLLYKPVAAIVYAAGYQLMSSGILRADALLQFITGIAMLALALLALPATMKAVVPPLSSASNSGGLGSVMAVGASGAALVATGGASSAAASGATAAGAGGTVSSGLTAGASPASAPGATAAVNAAGTAAVNQQSSGSTQGPSGWALAQDGLRGAAGAATAVERTASSDDADDDGPAGSENLGRQV